MLFELYAVRLGLNVTTGMALDVVSVWPAGAAKPVWFTRMVALQIWPQVAFWSENACLPQFLLSRLPKLMMSRRTWRFSSCFGPILPSAWAMERSTSLTHGLRQE